MKLQLDIPEKINKKLKMYKINNNLVTIAAAVNKILAEKFKNDKTK